MNSIALCISSLVMMSILTYAAQSRCKGETSPDCSILLSISAYKMPATLVHAAGKDSDSSSLQTLEYKLRTQLNRTWITHRSDRTKSPERNVRANLAKIGVIENIECLTTKLQARVFAKPDVLGHGEI